MHEVDRDTEYSILKAIVHFDGSKNQTFLFFWYMPEHIPFKIVFTTTPMFSTSHALFSSLEISLRSHYLLTERKEFLKFRTAPEITVS